MKNILEEFRMERQYDFMKKYKITKVKYEVVMKRIYEDEKLTKHEKIQRFLNIIKECSKINIEIL